MRNRRSLSSSASCVAFRPGYSLGARRWHKTSAGIASDKPDAAILILRSAFADRRVHGDLPACLSKIPRETNGRPDKSCDLPPSRRATCVLSDRSDVQCRLQPGQRVSGVGIGINIPAGAAFKQMVSPQQKRIRKLTSLAPLVEPPRASLTFCRMSRGTIVRCCPTAFCVFKQSLEFGCTPQAWMAPQLTILDRFDRLAALEPAPLSAGRVSTMDQVY